MSDHQPADDDRFAERVARVLRGGETFGDGFDTSLAAAIRRDRPLRRALPRHLTPLSIEWWTLPGSVRLSPVAALAVAAAVAVIAVAGTVRVSSTHRPVQTVAASTTHDTITLVRFVFVGKATSVALVGDFNRWGAAPATLNEAKDGMWTISVPLSNGRHEYAFIVDGKRWVPDPLAPASSDDFDTKSSVITIGT